MSAFSTRNSWMMDKTHSKLLQPRLLRVNR
jgi:hypothetical protein